MVVETGRSLGSSTTFLCPLISSPCASSKLEFRSYYSNSLTLCLDGPSEHVSFTSSPILLLTLMVFHSWTEFLTVSQNRMLSGDIRHIICLQYFLILFFGFLLRHKYGICSKAMVQSTVRIKWEESSSELGAILGKVASKRQGRVNRKLKSILTKWYAESIPWASHGSCPWSSVSEGKSANSVERDRSG